MSFKFLLFIFIILLANCNTIYCNISSGTFDNKEENVVASTETTQIIKLMPKKGDEKYVTFGGNDGGGLHLTATFQSVRVKKTALFFHSKKTSARLFANTEFKIRHPTDLPEIQYFEMTLDKIGNIDAKNEKGHVEIGLKGVHHTHHTYQSNGFIRLSMPAKKYAEGDVVGCGLYTPNSENHFIFFTKMDKSNEYEQMRLVELENKYLGNGGDSRIKLIRGSNTATAVYTPEIVIAGEGTQITANFKMDEKIRKKMKMFKMELEMMVENRQFEDL